MAGESMLGARAALATMLGVMFNGKRDVYEAAGYPKTLTFGDYYGAYKRGDIARRVVTAAPAETWRLDPEVLDGNDEADAADDTEFAQAVAELAMAGQPGQFLHDQAGLFQVLHRLDRVAGIGRYGVLFLGLADGRPLDKPVKQGGVEGTAGLLYMTVFTEANAQIESYDDDPSSPRYGLPEYYMLGTRGSDGDVVRQRTHWSRCIHIAEDVDDDEVFGTPRLEAVFNRTVDLLKIMAGAGEAAWKLLDAGQFLSTTDGKRLPVDPEQLTALEDQIDEYVHGLRRWLLTDGLQASPVSGQMTDPTGLVMINVSLIAAATGIPQRILMGSERGELASSQDATNWAAIIETRQRTQVAPYIIRPVIGRLIYAGVLPAPKSGNFVVKWQALTEADRVQEATVAEKVAGVITALGWEVEPEDFLTTYLPELPPAAVTIAPEPTLGPATGLPADGPDTGDPTSDGTAQDPARGKAQDAAQENAQGTAAKVTGDLSSDKPNGKAKPKTNTQGAEHGATWAQYP